MLVGHWYIHIYPLVIQHSYWTLLIKNGGFIYPFKMVDLSSSLSHPSVYKLLIRSSLEPCVWRLHHVREDTSVMLHLKLKSTHYKVTIFPWFRDFSWILPWKKSHGHLHLASTALVERGTGLLGARPVLRQVLSCARCFCTLSCAACVALWRGEDGLEIFCADFMGWLSLYK